MALNRFRIAASILILFNAVGTVVSWAAHLSKPGTSDAHAIVAGTEFTGPIIIIALWIGCVAMMLMTGRIATIGLWLMTVFAAVFDFGAITELFKKNIGVTTSKWHFIIGADVVSLAVGLAVAVLGIAVIARSRRVSTSSALPASG